MGKTSQKAKTPLDEFKAATPKSPLMNNQAVTSMRNLTTTLAYPKILTYSWTFAPIPNWTWSCSSFLFFDAQISNLWLILCTNTNTWLTPHQPFDCCSWFAIASLRNTNEIFNVSAREFAWLQNSKAYK